MQNLTELRKKMISEQLIPRGISDEKVLSAFLKVSREKFIPEGEIKGAYSDFPLPIGHDQTISQPYMVALMTECLQLKGNEKVLEIGTGSGYQTAILAEIAKEVYTIDRIGTLLESARGRLSGLGYKNINCKTGDGTLGWPEEAPFDAIIVTAGAPNVPQTLIEQLGEGGRLVIPVGDSASQTLTVVEKKGSDTNSNNICSCVFVPLIGKEGWSK